MVMTIFVFDGDDDDGNERGQTNRFGPSCNLANIEISTPTEIIIVMIIVCSCVSFVYLSSRFLVGAFDFLNFS